MLEFFQTKVLAAARPKDQEGGLGLGATIRGAVDAAAPGIEQSFAGKPAVAASIHDTMGQSYLYLGEPALAIRHHESALALRRQLRPDHPETLTSMSSLATAFWSAGRLAQAVTLHEETLSGGKPGSAPTIPTRWNQWAASLLHTTTPAAWPRLCRSTSRHSSAPTKLGPDHPDTLTSMNNLASAYQDAGRLAERSCSLRRRSSGGRPRSPPTILTL